MPAHARAIGHRVLVGVALAIYSIAGPPRTLSAQQPLEGEGLALDLLEKLEYTRAGADAITASMTLVVFEEQYCRPPDPPSKAREEQFLKAREATLAEYRNRYSRLRVQLLNLIGRNGRARRVVDLKLAGNPADAQAWDPWRRAFTRAAKAIGDKRAELDAIPVVRCSTPEPQQTAPDQTPPADPGIQLPEPKVRPVNYPEFKTPFCSQEAKQAVIQQFRAVAWDYYMNYQDAREYHDAITDALSQGLGNPSVLRALLPAARESLDVHTKALDDFNKELDGVRALPVIDCGEQQQASPATVPPLVFDPFVFPAVPQQFCTPEARDETVRQLEAARSTARRNHDRAAGRITELGERITKGDNSAATGGAYQEASRRASEWLQQSRALDAELQRAAAIPVVQCESEMEQRSPVGGAFASGSGIRVGFIYNRATFTRFEGMARDVPGIASASSDEGINQFGGYVELIRGPWFYGAGIRHGQHRVHQSFLPGEGRPTLGRATIGGYFGDIQLGWRFSINREITLGAYGGPVLTNNRGRFFWTYPDGDIEGERSHMSVKTGVGAFAEIELRPTWYARVGAQHVSINSDADDHTGFNLSVNRQFRFGPHRFLRPGPGGPPR